MKNKKTNFCAPLVECEYKCREKCIQQSIDVLYEKNCNLASPRVEFEYKSSIYQQSMEVILMKNMYYKPDTIQTWAYCDTHLHVF